MSQLHLSFLSHVEHDERRFSDLNEALTGVKVDVGNLKGRLLVVGGLITILVPVLTTIITEVVHAFGGGAK